MSLLQRSPSTRARAVRRLSPGECRHWLANHHVGRLAYTGGRGPRAVVVSYAMTDESIVVRLPDYNEIVHYAPGAVVSFEVEDFTETVSGVESVSVLGTAALVRPSDDLAASLAESWPEGVVTSVICLPMTAVEGYERSDHQSR